MASPTLIAFSEADSGTANIANGSGETSATLTWQTGDILIAFAGNEGVGTGDGFHAPTNTGTGLGTWSQLQLHSASSDPGMGAWSNVATANGSGTVTITLSSVNSNALAIGVYQWRAPSGATIAVGTSKNTNDLTTTPFTTAITMTSADSAVCWMMDDWGANAGTSYTYSPTPTSHNASTPGPSATPVGPTQEGTHYTFGFADLDDETGTGSQSFGVTGSGLTSPKVSLVVVEVTISGGGSGPPPRFNPIPFMAPQGGIL